MSHLGDLPSEQINPRSMGLDLLSSEEIVDVINTEDRRVAEAVNKVRASLSTAVDRAAESIRSGGRIHSFGAGTSGRLAVLDASEAHPTFGVSPDLVQGHIAGGDRALRSPVEGAEDDPDAGAAAVDAAAVTGGDVVIALSASGRTPWCVGVLRRASALGAFTVAVTCNEAAPMKSEADLSIIPLVGPEVITGSTRMKAGTAQKLVLNTITTGAMVRAGFTYGNLMVGLTPTNEKLRERARRLVRKITGHDNVDVPLEQCGWSVRAACLMLMHRLSPETAHQRLAAYQGSLREALQHTDAKGRRDE